MLLLLLLLMVLMMTTSVKYRLLIGGNCCGRLRKLSDRTSFRLQMWTTTVVLYNYAD
jgi:hypothetical protein